MFVYVKQTHLTLDSIFWLVRSLGRIELRVVVPNHQQARCFYYSLLIEGAGKSPWSLVDFCRFFGRVWARCPKRIAASMEALGLPLIMSALTALVSGVFALIVLRRWWEKRRPHLAAWGIGLALYFLGSLSQVVLSFTWSPVFFGLWYWAGALMVAPWLGQGTIYLLVRRGNIARNIQMALILVGVMTLPWAIFFTPMNASAWYPGAEITQIFRDQVDANGNVVEQGIMTGSARGTVRFFSPIMNVWGTLALVGGALYSAHLFRRKQIMRNRVVGNWLIALGGLFPAFSGALIRLDRPELKYFGEMIGIVLIFVGFWMATNVPDEAPQSAQPVAAGD
jgi:hypothetical protein